MLGLGVTLGRKAGDDVAFGPTENVLSFNCLLLGSGLGDVCKVLDCRSQPTSKNAKLTTANTVVMWFILSLDLSPRPIQPS